MVISTHTARIIGPVRYVAKGGATHQIPLGPCLLEQADEKSIDIVWGARGQSSAALPVEEVEAARGNGNLVLLD